MLKRTTSISLLGKILISTSLAITLLFAVTGWIVQDHATRLTTLSLEEEVQTGFRAYEALWRARAELLSSVSQILSRMPDVRAAFSTRDAATIRDTAGEIWSRLGREDAVFLVCDPRGNLIASLGRVPQPPLKELPLVRTAAARFPRQSSGFIMLGGTLYQVAVTPVYVESAREPALITVLVAGYVVDDGVASRLQQAIGDTSFTFTVGDRVVASSGPGPDSPSPFVRELRRPLLDLDGHPIGELVIFRSFDAAQSYIAQLRRDIFFIWAIALSIALALIYFLARRVLKPVAELDRAATEITKGNYDYVIQPRTSDELGRLAQTFNSMTASLREARHELIRQERIGTIGRLSTSLVHDLRNPLAAIYGGAELLVDSNLSPDQVKRLASNIYKSSRRIQELLQDLVNVARDSVEQREPCRLADVVRAAIETLQPQIDSQHIDVRLDIPEDLEATIARSRVERVFLNLAGNALEAMPSGGSIHVSASSHKSSIDVRFEDSGPGVSPAIRDRLFQPFVTAGKRSGLGLGLALSRQTILDHGGDLWLDLSAAHGACFCLRLPAA